MASTTFIDNQTVIYAAWLNDVNNAVYNGIFVSPSITASNVVCTGVASGAGFTALVNNTLASPAAIGNVTPNTGAFTTLSATSATLTGALNANSAALTTPLPISSGGTGLNAVGTSGYALTSDGSGLVYKKLGLGMTGETWYDVSGSRGFNSTYTNSNSYPIQVNLSLNLPAGGGYSIICNGINVGRDANTANVRTNCSFIVPTGGTYSVSGTGSVFYWAELY
jgi:hypothetical protein